MKKMPEGELVRVGYSRHTTAATAEFEGRIGKDVNGAFVLQAMKESHGPLYEKRVDAEVMQQIREIIREERMYRYKEHYLPKLHVLDGWQWSFSATFSDGTTISSSGSNARPHDDGLDRIRTLMEELIQDSSTPVVDP